MVPRISAGLAIDTGSPDRDTRRMTASEQPLENARVVITREGLRDGSLLARVRSGLLPGMKVKTDAEIEASLDAVLAGHDARQDVWLFGYGSLMWNPAFIFAEQRPALLRGWHRRFCLGLTMGRGSPDWPGLMLALDHGGSCQGIAFRVAAPARDELLLVWRREMFGQAYLARWVNVQAAQETFRAISFVVNRRHERYTGPLSEPAIAARLATAAGALGSGTEYLHQTIEHLRELGLRDRRLERLERLVAQHHHATSSLVAASTA